MSEYTGKTAVLRDLSFHYRFTQPTEASGECLFLLHGSGVDETTLVPLAKQIAPDAALVAARGRIPQEDGFRWFERITPTSFEQASIRTETDAFATFVAEATKRHRIDLSRATFLGYSNGANLVSSLMLLHSGLVRRAALLRAMPVLAETPPTDLGGTKVLMIAGAADLTYGPFAPALVTLLSQRGATVDARIIASGHEIGDSDATIVRQWLADPSAVA
ncbi:alpha/beta hydrolase [Mesorhizobium sp. M4A.F.Ca.ET.022.05.2.1]|uniref:alpha/beta hydrolase n=1 Tax=Mesorhizobium sp. M4A.F.Ca.ET.022.05.2.1 TaxID=2496653 RepID=UPI000FCCD110|nr:alpha/beta hydrolase [Mesorhizobium sp. M4A.F.Ca.ET.022.05.2.1]RVC79256.1 alpha/beta hydrolase [Mesorhizobium sp. M4A.F.Ca.ET.022.05.2.1]